jgi:hypothetical protein
MEALLKLITIIKLKQIASSTEEKQYQYLDSIGIEEMDEQTFKSLQRNVGMLDESLFKTLITKILKQSQHALITQKKLK